MAKIGGVIPAPLREVILPTMTSRARGIGRSAVDGVGGEYFDAGSDRDLRGLQHRHRLVGHALARRGTVGGLSPS